MKGVIAGGVTNIILDYVFVYPLQMGMRGAALATVIGSTLTVLILLTHFLSSKNQLRIFFEIGQNSLCQRYFCQWIYKLYY